MSLPLCFASKILNRKLFLIEPNMVLGRSNKIFIKYCNKIFCYSDKIKNFPDRFKNKYGLWLIGYDGKDKSYSTDISLLKEIHNIIDAMPIRKREATKENDKCK